MTKRIVLGALLLAGCSKGPTTKPGPLGEMDLAAKLPSGVTVPADVKSFEATHKLCAVATDDEPIEVRVRWKAFTKESASYVSSYSVELVKSVPGLEVMFEREPSKMDHPNANAVINANAAKGGPLIMTTEVPLKCTAPASSKRVGTANPAIYIRADGVSSTNPVW
jgi:hypothetical protein